MKKYQKQSGMTVDAEYGEEQGNPFFEALPEILGKEEVMKRLRSQIPYPKDIQKTVSYTHLTLPTICSV
mgnify:CR=1 FL=1